jgi:hypothetical protein
MIPSVNGKNVHELIVYVCEKGADPELESTNKDGETPLGGPGLQTTSVPEFRESSKWILR